jgi:hypothetical protein
LDSVGDATLEKTSKAFGVSFKTCESKLGGSFSFQQHYFTRWWDLFRMFLKSIVFCGMSTAAAGFEPNFDILPVIKLA